MAGIMRWRYWAGVVLEAFAWLTVIAMAGVGLVRSLGFDQPNPLPVIYSVLPTILLPSIVICVLANVAKRYALAIASGVVMLGLLLLLAPVTISSAGTPAGGDPRVTVAFGNIYNNSVNQGEAIRALMATHADLIVMAELNPETVAEAKEAGLFTTYPYNSFDITDVSVFSKVPLSDVTIRPTGARQALDIRLEVGGRAMRIIGVHPDSPDTHDQGDSWQGDLEGVADVISATGPPTLVIGDFNTTYWQPAFRELLTVGAGYRDAHALMGEGLTASWPDHKRVPPFARIDHALVDSRVVPTDVRNVTLPGSDHIGFVIEVAVKA
jgi:endonuclease/exonuclease/phosphatase (EEP) superfamily protein YafD